MTWGEAGQFTTGIAALVAAIGSWINNRRLAANREVMDEVKDHVQTLRIEIDGRLSELLESRQAEGFSAGEKSRRAEEAEEKKKCLTLSDFGSGYSC